MINVTLTYNKAGELRGFTASGHGGGGPKGSDVLCAAVSVLFRTGARLFEGCSDVNIRGNADEEGFLSLDVIEVRKSADQWFRGVADFIRLGLLDLHAEFPNNVTIEEKIRD